MSFSDDYEIDPAIEDDNVAPEPHGYTYPIIDTFEESMMTARLMELCPPPSPESGLTWTDDELEMIPDYAQPFAGALRAIAAERVESDNKTVKGLMSAAQQDADKIKHFLGIHALIAFYVARMYRLDLNAVIDETMTRLEHEHAEDKKQWDAIQQMNMTAGGSVVTASATENGWPDPEF